MMEDNTLKLVIALGLLVIVALVLLFGNMKIGFKINRERKDIDDERRKDLLGSLSNAEYQVLKLLSKGRTNKEIAEAIFLSEKTVRNYVSSIFSKLNLSTRAEAAAYAVKHHVENHLPTD